MAQIDTSIYNQLKPVQIENPLAQYAQLAQVQSAQNQNRLAELVFGEKQREVSENRLLGDAYKSALKLDGTIDRNALYGGLAQGGLGTKIPGVQKGFADQDKSQREAEKAQIEGHLKKFEAAGQIMAPVKDQASWTIAKQQTAQVFGAEAAAQMPDAYDPALVEQKRAQAMTVKDQLEQTWKQKGYDLDVSKFGLENQKFGETVRNNKTQNAIAQGNLGVAQGNLGVSRERLNFDKAQPKGQYDAERGLLVDPRTGVAKPVIGPDGAPVEAKVKPPTEFQGKSAAFGARAEQSDKVLAQLEKNGVANTGIIKSIAQGAGEMVPFMGEKLGAAIGSGMNTLPSILGGPSGKQQQVEQARRDFVNAVLRQESGAAIAESEFSNATRQYFPQPGDTKDVITQKAQNRKLAIQGLKNNAGKAAFSAPVPAAGSDGWSIVEVK
jgi:hypothetical protein